MHISVKFGVRPRISSIFLNSSAVKPMSWACSNVAGAVEAFIVRDFASKITLRVGPDREIFYPFTHQLSTVRGVL